MQVFTTIKNKNSKKINNHLVILSFYPYPVSIGVLKRLFSGASCPALGLVGHDRAGQSKGSKKHGN
jgi:hypothetical protein